MCSYFRVHPSAKAILYNFARQGSSIKDGKIAKIEGRLIRRAGSKRKRRLRPRIRFIWSVIGAVEVDP